MKTKLSVAKGIVLILFAAGVETLYAQVPNVGPYKCINPDGTRTSCDDSSGGGNYGRGNPLDRGLDAVIDGVINLFGLGGPSPAEIGRQRQSYNLNEEGRELARRGDRRGALAKYREALALDPSSNAIRLNIANNESVLAYEAGDLQLAIAKARESTAYSNDPAYRKWLSDLETAFAEQQRRQQANALNEEGRKLWEKGDIKGALAKFQGALALSPSDTYRGNVALAEQRLIVQQANDQDVKTLRAGANAALASLKRERSENVQLNLEAFRPGNPPPEEVASYLAGGQGSARGPAGLGQPAPAGDQLQSVAASGRSVAETELGGRNAETNQQASGGARLGFDTPGQAAGSLPPVNLRGMRRSPDGAPIIPPERRTEAITRLETKRDEFRARRLELGQEISSLDTKLANPSLSGEERQTLLVKKAELRQEEFTTRQEEITLNFSIELEDGKISGGRDGGDVASSAKPVQNEPPSPGIPPTPTGPSANEERPLRP